MDRDKKIKLRNHPSRMSVSLCILDAGRVGLGCHDESPSGMCDSIMTYQYQHRLSDRIAIDDTL